MTRIRATCPSCGEVDLRPDDIRLEIVHDGLAEVGSGSNYRFLCPDCEQMITKPADERIARLLASGGVAISINRDAAVSPEERLRLAHPEEPPAGPPLTRDDLLDLHLKLSADDWFEELRALSH